MKHIGDYTGLPRFEIERIDPLYPQALLELKEPPKVLYGIGKIPEGECISVVGARKATPYGLHCASAFAGYMAEMGFTVVSGGAMGCDQAAHRAALKAGEPTIAIMGCGADIVYPSNAGELLRSIAETGAVISECPWGTDPKRWTFRTRNRIIAGLSRATLIVEAGMPSGTFSTADYALETGRDVFAVPGSILSRNSKGSNWLISHGATPIIDRESLYQALNLMEKNKSFTMRNGLESEKSDPILAAIIAAPSTAEALASAFPLSTVKLMGRLAELEIKGLIVRQLDGSYTANPFIT